MIHGQRVYIQGWMLLANVQYVVHHQLKVQRVNIPFIKSSFYCIHISVLFLLFWIFKSSFWVSFSSSLRLYFIIRLTCFFHCILNIFFIAIFNYFAIVIFNFHRRFEFVSSSTRICMYRTRICKSCNAIVNFLSSFWIFCHRHFAFFFNSSRFFNWQLILSSSFWINYRHFYFLFYTNILNLFFIVILIFFVVILNLFFISILPFFIIRLTFFIHCLLNIYFIAILNYFGSYRHFEFFIVIKIYFSIVVLNFLSSS